MTDFIRFHEINDHEGETWNFWLQLDGNEEEIFTLRSLLSALEDNEQYELTDDIEPDSVVDNLVRYADEGYMNSHNKVEGKFTCPASIGEYGDDLYKGGIKDYFKKD